MAEKEFKTLDEQIAILKSRGLTITDESAAKTFLLRNNYYRVSGYSLTLRSHDVFYPSANFQNIVDIYEFDHELRHILLGFLESIEVSVKSIYSYEFTRVYGPVGYLNDSIFTDAAQYAEIMRRSEQQKAARLPHESYLKHFVNDLHQDIPLWAYVDLFTFGDISRLYKISPDAIKTAVASAYGLAHISNKLMGHFLHSLTIIRNLCAHGGRLYNRLFEQKPRLSKKEKSLLFNLPDGSVDNSHLYSFIFIMKRLLKRDEFSDMKSAITQLTKKYPFVDMHYYGFRSDWESKL